MDDYDCKRHRTNPPQDSDSSETEIEAEQIEKRLKDGRNSGMLADINSMLCFLVLVSSATKLYRDTSASCSCNPRDGLRAEQPHHMLNHRNKNTNPICLCTY